MKLDSVIVLLMTLTALLASAFFSAAELAIFSIRLPALKRLRESNDPRGEWVDEMLNHPKRFLSAILLGNVGANALVAIGMVLLWENPKSPSWGANWGMPILIASLLLLMVGELFPKAIASRRSAPVALWMIGWIRDFEWFLRPLALSVSRLADKWVDHFVPSWMRPMRGLAEDEYLSILDIGTREGVLRPSERRLIEQILDLADRNLRELMVPRGEMKCLSADMDLAAMRSQASAFQHRRLPIFSESLDSIVGVLNVKRFLLTPDMDPIASLEPPAFVPETMSALELLKNFLRTSQHMALVVDEFGGVEGLITLEDVVEEIFGEIYDEYDNAAPNLEEIEPGVFVVQGACPLPFLSHQLGMEFEADGVDTLAGWLTEQLAALPHPGDRFSLRPYSFQVEKMSRLRIKTILVRDERKGKT